MERDAFDAALAEVARDPRNAGRLDARIPQRRYVCFYPMNKKRDGADNWYNLPYAERAAMMVEHGKIGRSYHGLGEPGDLGLDRLDDWEWGVDLYADEPLVSRSSSRNAFDAASSRFGEFGRIWTGMRSPLAALPDFLSGDGHRQLLAEREPALR